MFGHTHTEQLLKKEGHKFVGEQGGLDGGKERRNSVIKIQSQKKNLLCLIWVRKMKRVKYDQRTMTTK